MIIIESQNKWICICLFHLPPPIHPLPEERSSYQFYNRTIEWNCGGRERLKRRNYIIYCGFIKFFFFFPSIRNSHRLLTPPSIPSAHDECNLNTSAIKIWITFFIPSHFLLLWFAISFEFAWEGKARKPGGGQKLRQRVQLEGEVMWAFAGCEGKLFADQVVFYIFECSKSWVKLCTSGHHERFLLSNQ